MADSTTANYALTKPEVGSSRDTWGAKLNVDWDMVDAIMAALMPIGAMVDFAGSTAMVPSGWLMCDGTVYNIATYPKLAAVFGNYYGGDGVTTFAVPDCRGRVVAGVGNTTDSGGITTGFTLGFKSGWWSVTLTTSNLPAATVTINAAGDHTHGGSTDSQGLHSHNGSTDAQGDHTHTYSGVSAGGINFTGGPISIGGQSNTGAAGSHSHNITTTNDGSHSHGMTTSTAGSHTHTGSIAGSSSPFGVWQPTIGLNKIIFAGPPGHTSLSSPIPGAPALMASPMRGVG